MDARNLAEDPPPTSLSRWRRLIRAFWLGLLLLLVFPQSAGGGLASVGEIAPALNLVELAGSQAPPGFQLQEVSVEKGQEAGAAEEVVTATYLGPGVRNEIEYSTFASVEAAESFFAGPEADACSVRSRAVCSALAGSVVVSASSSSTCHIPTHDVLIRAEHLLSFGIARVDAT